jgi:hypothetical protein
LRCLSNPKRHKLERQLLELESRPNNDERAMMAESIQKQLAELNDQ